MGTRSWLTCLALVLGVGGCDACSGLDRNVVSHVDVPTTTDALETWAAEEGHTVSVERMERPSGGAACGHSLACVIILPILVADAVLPSTLQHGVVSDEDGTVLYSGVFDLRGRLLHARVRDGEWYREITRLNLEELSEHPIVERGRVRLDAEGRTVEQRSTPLLPQVDLLSMYASALADEGDADDRADLVAEELHVLGAEGVGPVVTRYRDAEPFEDEELGLVLDVACAARELPGKAELTAVAVERGGVRSAIAAVGCLPDGAPGAARLVERAVGGACGDEVQDRAASAVAELATRHALAAEVASHATDCERPTRATLVRVLAGQTVSDEEWIRGLHEDSRPALFVARLSARRADDRRILVLALDAEHAVSGRIAHELRANTTDGPTVDEAVRAAAVYSATELAGFDDDGTRHELLAWLERGNGAAKAAAADVIERDGGPQRPTHAAALMLLRGDSRYLAAAVHELDDRSIRWRSMSVPNGSWNEPTLVAYALSQTGCTREQIEEAARASRLGHSIPLCPR